MSKPKPSRLELCSWTGSYGELQSHIDECPLHTVQCKHCPDFVMRRDTTRHIKVCTGREPCEICGEMVVKGEEQLEKHLKQCLEMESDCSWKNFGCNARFKRRNKETHRRHNMPEHVGMLRNGVSNLRDVNPRLDRLERLNDVVQW